MTTTAPPGARRATRECKGVHVYQPELHRLAKAYCSARGLMLGRWVERLIYDAVAKHQRGKP